VIEIHRPGDEALEKLSFYAILGVPEVWVIDRDSRVVEIYALDAGGQTRIVSAADGWLHSAATGIQLQSQSNGKLAMQMVGDPAIFARLDPHTKGPRPSRTAADHNTVYSRIIHGNGSFLQNLPPGTAIALAVGY